ncbi:Uncharacterised protein [Halioglobus japonicus]|nr:Uncharacterised protein [Halioglobus japonicus]
MSARLPIFHLASHARAGETLFLKLLNSHSRVCVPVQVEQEESEIDKAFIAEVRDTGIRDISIDHPYAQSKPLASNSVILIKQGIWLHKVPFNGITLVRNPLSFVDSMMTYNTIEGFGGGWRKYGRKRYAKTFNRLLRWSENMSDELYNQIDSKNSVIDALCCFYNSRVTTLKDYQKEIFRYEDIVNNPARELNRACLILDIDFENGMLNAHQNYSETDKGHGMNNLARDIDTASLNKWRQGDKRVFQKVKRATIDTAKSVGYSYNEPYLVGV